MDKTRKTRTEDGKLNLVGEQIAELRQKKKMSQNALARELQLLGVNLNSIKMRYQTLKLGNALYRILSCLLWQRCSMFLPMTSSVM